MVDLVPLPPVLASDATAAQLVESYLGTLQSQRSRDTMRESFKRLARTVTGGASDDYRAIPWHHLDFDRLNQIRTLLAASYIPSTANLTFGALRQMLRVAYLNGEIEERLYLAAHGVKGIKGERVTKGREITADEETGIFKACLEIDGDDERTMWLAILAVLFAAGARREEVCRLFVSSYRPNEKRLHLLGKGNKERWVPFEDRAVNTWLALRKMIEAPHQRMFLSLRTQQPMSVWTLWFRVKGFATKAGVPSLAPHDFRRTYGSRGLERGLDLTEMQRLMGHASVNTTARYDKRGSKKLEARRMSISMYSGETNEDK